jgi:hypothetical protein
MPRRRPQRRTRNGGGTSIWNAGTLVNVLLIPTITFIILAVGFYFSSKEKFITYDQAALDVGLIKVHNASMDQEVKDIETGLEKISSQVDALRHAAPLSGPGSGGGSAVGGGFQTKH